MFRSLWALSVLWIISCESDFKPYEFRASIRQPIPLNPSDVQATARRELRPNEVLDSVATFSAAGIGQTVVQAVASTPNDSRTYVVDEDGNVSIASEFWAREREARTLRFGKLTPRLFDSIASLGDEDLVSVDVTVYADLPEPVLPYDGTDRQTSIDEYETWTIAHSAAQVTKIRQAKERLTTLFSEHSFDVTENPRGLPTIRARLPVKALRSVELNHPDVVMIDTVRPEGEDLLGYAGVASMQGTPSAGGLSGGACTGGVCDGLSIDVGYWERVGNSAPSGMAKNNSRVGTNSVTGYAECPTTCTSDAMCPTTGVGKTSCRAPSFGAPKICVQDHLTWVVASVGMFGNYSYDALVPGGSDPFANATSTFASSGAWNTDKRFGNLGGQLGLDYLIAPPGGQSSCETQTQPPTMFVNRSQDGTPIVANFPARAFGTFVTAASGNSNPGVVTCSLLKNGLCVGGYDYFTFSDQNTHRRSVGDMDTGSSFKNNLIEDSTLERPHLLGPGSHLPNQSGLHMPSIDVDPTAMPTPGPMRHADYSSPAVAIVGTSFASPAVLGIAIQALQYEGLFSSLAYPQVNKAVLLASTRDANADGRIGKAATWSANAPTQDAEDGAGQINIPNLASILSNNTYAQIPLQNSSFSSCGTGCRKYTVTTLNVQAAKSFRAALAWHSCMINEGSTPILNNDLDLVLVCGGTVCPGTLTSNTITSELEMLERSTCAGAQKGDVAACSLEIRIKDGVALQSCGSTTFERVGVAWRN